ncbi:MAG TPA: LapA family protein [Mariniphaga anaerophila]|uniref:LapA family protein n=1 Tax=Mariniphaga anaerophila TaxID=1484053 RepID=A0A831LY24_9BACT|nr:LapA family protein [Mariniphaga anaerophila]
MKNIFEKINLTPKQVLNIFLIIVLLIFISQNLEMVRVKFLFFKFELPIIILIGLVFFIGFFTAHVFNQNKQKREKKFLVEREEKNREEK